MQNLCLVENRTSIKLSSFFFFLQSMLSGIHVKNRFMMELLTALSVWVEPIPAVKGQTAAHTLERLYGENMQARLTHVRKMDGWTHFYRDEVPICPLRRTHLFFWGRPKQRRYQTTNCTFLQQQAPESLSVKHPLKVVTRCKSKSLKGRPKLSRR